MVLVLVFKVGMVYMYSFAFGVWEMDSRSGQGVWREGYEKLHGGFVHNECK
jgi:hypothetical protein